MRKEKIVAMAGMAALGSVAAYATRRRWVAAILGLPPARFGVRVRRGLRVPMPDGVTLAADLYAPAKAGRFPTILIRTPYGRRARSGPNGLIIELAAQRFAERGYLVFVQDVRGRYGSGGEFEPFRSEAADGRATLEWIAQQPWFGGSLACWGPSYVGYVQWALVQDAPPFLKALVPAVTSSRLAVTFFLSGAFTLDTTLRWLQQLEALHRWWAKRDLPSLMPGRQEAALQAAFDRLPISEADLELVGHPIPYYRGWLDHPDPTDPYWHSLDFGHVEVSSGPAVHLLGGWYDIFLSETLRDYASMKAAGRTPYLTIGPWMHYSPQGYIEAIRTGLEWFDAHLKGNLSRRRLNPVRIYMMGGGGWRDLPAWPPLTRPYSLYLQSGRILSGTPVMNANQPDKYIYDPAHPTPSLGGPLMHPQAGPQDNRSLEARTDVLVYTSPPLAHEIEIAGVVRAILYVRSSLEHTDFFARLCDVYPDGRSVNVCDGLLRVKPGVGELQPDGSLRVEVELWPTAYRFAGGHSIRLQVSSGAHPRYSRNPGTGEPLGSAVHLALARQTVYHDSAHLSALVLPEW